MPKKVQNIAKLRRKVATLDQKIQKLLSQRMKMIQRIGHLKAQKKLSVQNIAVEKQKLKKLKYAYEKKIFAEIFKQSRAVQRKL